METAAVDLIQNGKLWRSGGELCEERNEVKSDFHLSRRFAGSLFPEERSKAWHSSRCDAEYCLGIREN